MNNSEIKYSDITTGFVKHTVTTDLARITNFDSVRRSVRSLILTNKYERLLDPRIGGNISALLFEPMTPDTTILLKNAIDTTIKNYEPRAIISEIQVIPDYDRNAYYVSITFSLKYLTQQTTLELFLDRIR